MISGIVIPVPTVTEVKASRAEVNSDWKQEMLAELVCNLQMEQDEEDCSTVTNLK